LTWIVWIALGVALATAAVFTYRIITRAPDLAIVVVKSESIDRILAAVGRVRAEERVSLFSRAAGQVITLLKDEGATVAAGEVLGAIDPGQPRAVLAQRNAAIVGQARQLEQSRRNLARAQALLSKGFLARAGMETARLAVERDEQELQSARAAAREAVSRLEDFVLRAPMAGRILLRPIDPGQVVDVRTQIFEIVSAGAPEVETDVDEAVAGALRVGMRARLAPAGMNEQLYTGTVTFISPRVEPTTGGRTVRLSISAGPVELPPGLSVDVNITVETRSEALTLPRAAIARNAGASFVMILHDNKAVKQTVTFVDWPAERIVVTSGVKAGDQVALDPLKAVEGLRVTPITAPEPR
jgi:RND family efflux transporter MFP subunit